MQVGCSNDIQSINPQHQMNFVERKIVTAWGPCRFPIFFVKSQDPKGQMKFERTPAIPATAGDGLAYGVACISF
jgi:hypothetical protein